MSMVFSPLTPRKCGLVSVMGLVAWGKEGFTPVGTLQRFLSSAPLPKCLQQEAWQSSALGGLGFYLAGKWGSGMSVCSWVSHSELGQDLRDVPCTGCLSSAVPGAFVLLGV